MTTQSTNVPSRYQDVGSLKRRDITNRDVPSKLCATSRSPSPPVGRTAVINTQYTQAIANKRTGRFTLLPLTTPFLGRDLRSAGKCDAAYDGDLMFQFIDTRFKGIQPSSCRTQEGVNRFLSISDTWHRRACARSKEISDEGKERHPPLPGHLAIQGQQVIVNLGVWRRPRRQRQTTSLAYNRPGRWG